jgi:hypothetical protein
VSRKVLATLLRLADAPDARRDLVERIRRRSGSPIGGSLKGLHLLADVHISTAAVVAGTDWHAGYLLAWSFRRWA